MTLTKNTEILRAEVAAHIAADAAADAARARLRQRDTLLALIAAA